MTPLLGLIGCLLGGAAWKMYDNAELRKAKEQARESYGQIEKEREDRKQCNLELQEEVYLKLKLTHRFPNELYCKEPINHEKEIMRVVKRYLELRDIKYYDYGIWDLDGCEFDEGGKLRYLHGKKVRQFDDLIY